MPPAAETRGRMGRPSARRLALTAGALLLAVSGYAYFRHQNGDDEEFLTETIDRGPIAATVTASGTVNPVTTVQVGTYVSGPIKAIYADFNSKVAKGQLVAKIDPASYQVKVASAEAAVATAKARVAKSRADLELKRLTFDRNRQLLERNLIAQNDLDTAKSSYDQAVAQQALDEAGVRQATADLEAARINLGYTDITSPVDGVVVSRSVDVGQTVAASFQTPTLFLIAQDLTKMQVNASVNESDIGAVAVDQPATFRVDAHPDRDFRGKVVQVRNAPINVQNVITYDVMVAVDNSKLELRPGMTATIEITTAEADDALRLPVRALRFRPERTRRAGASSTRPPAAEGTGARTARPPAVWVPQPDGSIKRVAVQTGVRNESYAELVSGDLRENDLVVVGYRRPEPDAGATTQRPPSFMGGGGGRRYR